MTQRFATDVLIIGGGAAGLTAALNLAEHARVTVLSKGDIESASDYISHMCKAGYEGVVGFNLDGSHMEWQGVSVIDFATRRPSRFA